MKHIIALLAVISIATAANYDSAGRPLTASRLSAIKAETPARQSRCVDGDRHYYSLADSNARHAAQAAYLAAKPTAAEVIQAQQAIKAKTVALLAVAYIEPQLGRRLHIGNIEEWTALATFIPADQYPYIVDAYGADGVAKTYSIANHAALSQIIGMGAAARAAITDAGRAIKLAQAAAASRTALQAIEDNR